MFRLKQTLIRLMTGRRGIDKLYYALFVLYIILMLLGRIFPSPVWVTMSWVVFIYMFFRAFSRNLSQRQKENAAFERVWRKVKSVFRFTRDRMKDIRTKRYRKCPSCKTVLRLPIKRGKNKVVCPRCKKEFDVRVIL